MIQIRNKGPVIRMKIILKFQRFADDFKLAIGNLTL